eukprot:4631757-Prorocentrum_lima.AAC.1
MANLTPLLRTRGGIALWSHALRTVLRRRGGGGGRSLRCVQMAADVQGDATASVPPLIPRPVGAVGE